MRKKKKFNTMENAVHVYNPLHGRKGIGRRTGKVIERKRNLKNGVDNFEDYLTSEDDMTLNETNASAVGICKNLLNESMGLKEKQDVLKLQTLSDLKENVSHQIKKQGSATKVSDDKKFAATLLTRNSKVGKRTGKMIEKKRNINNDVDNFEDYLSSDGERTLDVTDASTVRSVDSLEAISSRSLMKRKDVPPGSQSIFSTEVDANRLPVKSQSLTEALENTKKVRLGTRNSIFGRRTGKDLLAGKELADLENFSNYLSDSKESSTLLTSPPEASKKPSNSADSSTSQDLLNLPKANTFDLEMGNDNLLGQNARKNMSSKNSSEIQNDDDENIVGGQPEANSYKIQQSSANKRNSINVNERTPINEDISVSKNMNKSQSEKRSKKRSSLAMQAIKNLAKRKSLSEKSSHAETRRDSARKNSSSENDVGRGQTVTASSVADSEVIKQIDLNDSNSESLDVSEHLITSYHKEVDESISFKISYENKDKRKSMVNMDQETVHVSHQSLVDTPHVSKKEKDYEMKSLKYTEQEPELDQDQSSPEISHTSKKASKSSSPSYALHGTPGADYGHVDNCSNQRFSKDERINMSTTAPKSKSGEDTDKFVSIVSVKLSEKYAIEKNSHVAKSTNGVPKSPHGLKKGPNSSLSTRPDENHKPDKESNRFVTMSKSSKQTKNSIGEDKVPFLEDEKIFTHPLRSSRKKYVFDDSESGSELEDVSVTNPKPTGKNEKKAGKGRMKKEASVKRICSKMNKESAESISASERPTSKDQHLKLSTRQVHETVRVNSASNKESTSNLQFMSVSSKAIPLSSKQASSASSSGGLNKSVRRMLDLSQGEDSDNPANSDAEEAVKSPRIGFRQVEQEISKLKRGGLVHLKTNKNHTPKHSSRNSDDENDEPVVFMSIASEKLTSASLHRAAKDECQDFGLQKSIRKVVDLNSDTDNVKNKNRKNKKSSAVSYNTKDGLEKEKGNKRKIVENTDEPHFNNNCTSKFSKNDIKKRKKDSTPQTELHDFESTDAITSTVSKPSLMSQELKDTPKTGDRQRFRNYRKKIFSGCIPKVTYHSKTKEIQENGDGVTEDNYADIVTLQAKKIQVGRKPKTGLKKSKSQKLKDQRKMKKNPQKVMVKIKQGAKPLHHLDKLELNELDEPKKEHFFLEVAKTYTEKLKSSSGKKRGRPRKKSMESGKLDESLCSPVSLRLIDSLPSVTPQSGVSFRKMRKLGSHVEEGNGVDIKVAQTIESKSISGKKRGRPRKSSFAPVNEENRQVEKARGGWDNNYIESNGVHKDVSQVTRVNSKSDKKRGRPQKSEVSSENEEDTQPEKFNSEYGNDGDESSNTPVSLKLIDALPNVTPRSGVSFRGRKNQSILHDDNNPSSDPFELTMQRYKRTDPESTPCGRNLKPANGLTSCLRDASVPRPFKKGRRVRISNFVISGTPKKTGRLEKVPDATATTVLSPSSSPVHYAETTNSGGANTCQQSFLLPDLSYFIVRPDQKETGLRRSSRTRVRPVAGYKGESVIYRRDSTGYGLVVHAIQPSVGEAKIKAKEEMRRKKRMKQKLKAMNVPVKANKRLSSHVHNLSLEITQSESLPTVNPETQEEVMMEIVSRRSNVIWKGPELAPVQDTDHLAGCVQLQHPSLSTGEIQLRALGQKAYEKTMETLIYTVIVGKAVLTVNFKSTTIETGDDFLIPRGSAYGLKNLRRDVARFHFVCLHNNPQEDL